jgi:hypothetical protein
MACFGLPRVNARSLTGDSCARRGAGAIGVSAPIMIVMGAVIRAIIRARAAAW